MKVLVTFVVQMDEEQAKRAFEDVSTREELADQLDQVFCGALENWDVDYAGESSMVMVRPVKEEEG